MISSAPTDAAPQSVIEHATATERSRHMLPYARPGRAATRQLGDLRTLPSAIWLADFTVIFDMEAIAIGVGRDARLSTANYAKSAGDESAAAKR
jgi:hypothetical protein